MDDNCLFCKIAAKQIPATIVHEDDEIVAFKDIAPQAPVHVILIPRQHFANLNELTPDSASAVGSVALAAKAIAAKLGVAESGWRLLANCGRDAGQTVHHLHFHLLAGKPLGGRLVE
jgi:histidine triad (HIT) family protein